MTGPHAVTLRPAVAADWPFLERVYAESRADELRAAPWTPERKAEFLRSQFAAQDAFYRENYPACAFLVVEREGRPIGRLYRDDRDDEIRLVDIALLAAERGRGVGGRLMRAVLDEAAARGVPVRIHVERTNPARRLYERLGFEVEAPGEVYDLLIRR